MKKRPAPTPRLFGIPSGGSRRNVGGGDAGRFFPGDAAPDDPVIHPKRDKRCPNGDVRAFARMQHGDRSREGRGDLDDGLGGLDLDKGLVEVDVVALVDEPLDDAALLEPLAEVRHREDSVGHQ